MFLKLSLALVLLGWTPVTDKVSKACVDCRSFPALAVDLVPLSVGKALTFFSVEIIYVPTLSVLSWWLPLAFFILKANLVDGLLRILTEWLNPGLIGKTFAVFEMEILILSLFTALRILSRTPVAFIVIKA